MEAEPSIASPTAMGADSSAATDPDAAPTRGTEKAPGDQPPGAADPVVQRIEVDAPLTATFAVTIDSDDLAQLSSSESDRFLGFRIGDES